MTKNIKTFAIEEEVIKLAFNEGIDPNDVANFNLLIRLFFDGYYRMPIDVFDSLNQHDESDLESVGVYH